MERPIHSKIFILVPKRRGPTMPHSAQEECKVWARRPKE